jgi:hypothetical protein
VSDCHECSSTGTCPSCEGTRFVQRKLIVRGQALIDQSRCGICAGTGRCAACAGRHWRPSEI